MVYESIKRNRYYDPSGTGFEFDHSSINHFQDIGSYHAATARMHNANLHDWGIARGLEVTKNIDEKKININPGVAIDIKGNLIVLSENGKGDIGSDPPNNNHTEVPAPVILDISSRAGQTCYVTIQLSEILRTGEGAGGRFEQVPWMRLQPVDGAGAYEDNGTSIILAIVVVDATGKLAELKVKDPALSFRRRLIGEEIEELRFRRATKDNGGVKEVIDTVLSPVDGSGLQVSILDKPALQLFAPDRKNTYLTLLNPDGQQSVQLDTTTGTGSIRIKNAENKGIGAFQTSDEGAGLLRLYNKTGERATIELFANQGESGVMKLFGTDGSVPIELNDSGLSTRAIAVTDNAGNLTASISADGSVNASGSLSVFGIISTSSVLFADTVNARAFGTISVNKLDNNPAVQLFASGGIEGYLAVFDASGNQAIRLDARGGVGTIVASGNIQAQGNGFVNQLVAKGTLFADGNVQAKGTLFADGNVQARGDIFGRTKNFVIDHPNDQTKNIIYTAIEGPEAAAYIRGKSQLVDGQAEIEFPEHFSLVVNSETITIQLTPCSAESKGLAVVSHSQRGFSIKELWQGEGNYDFDYFVAGVRQGMEHFTPVVDKGLTAFGEPMGEVVSGSPVESSNSPTPQVSSLNQPASAAPVVQPQAAKPEGAMPKLPIPTISSIPSPPAINFADKQTTIQQ